MIVCYCNINNLKTFIKVNRTPRPKNIFYITNCKQVVRINQNKPHIFCYRIHSYGHLTLTLVSESIKKLWFSNVC